MYWRSAARIPRHLFLALIGITLAACSKAPPTPSAFTAVFTTVSQPTQAIPTPYLPPSWTPHPTLTPRPTPTEAPTPTDVPTFTTEELCQYFKIIAPPGTKPYEFWAVISFGWTGVPVGTALVLTITQQGSKGGVRLDVPYDGAGIFPIRLKQLPGPGIYEWKAWVQDPQYGAICQQSGTFIRKALPIF